MAVVRYIVDDVAAVTEFYVSNLAGSGHMISNYAPYPQIRESFIPYLYFDSVDRPSEE